VPVPPAARARLLRACVDDAPGSTLVVTRDGRRAEALADDLGAEAHHDRRSPATRRAARRRFQSGEASVLVVTDDFPPRVELPALRRLVFDGPPPDLTQLSAWVLGPAVLEEEVRAVVLHDPKDLEAHAERLERAAPPVAALDLVGRRLRAAPASVDALARASGLEGPVVARYLEALVAAGGAVREGEGAVRGAPDWKDRHAGRVRRLRAGLSAVERWLRASGCRIAALAQAAGQPHEPECGLCDACDPDGALVPLRPPSAEERQRMQDMLRAMARSGPIPEGALFRGLQGPGLETRRAFERLLDALEGAGAVAREAESRRGQAVWMIRLTEQGRAPGALRLARVRDPQGSWKG
jgi:DNA-binding transcriptional ArsR family regulator